MLCKRCSLIILITFFSLPMVQGMFIPPPFFDAPSYRDKLEEGPYWRELINFDMPVRYYDGFISDTIGTKDGDILMVGTDARHRGRTDEGALDYSRRGYISKMTKQGELVWEGLAEEDVVFFSCEETGDDLYLVLGSEIENDSVGRAVLFAFDPDGSLLWRRTIESDTGDSAFDMTQDEHGNVFIAGVSDTDEGYDGLILKLDAEGNLIWRRTYDDGKHEMFTSISITNEGNPVMVGTKKWVKFLGHMIPIYSQALVVSYGPEGVLRWAISKGEDTDYTVPTDLEIDSNGTIAITGRVSIQKEKRDVLSILVDDNGNVIDSRSYPGFYEYDDYGYSIIEGGSGVFFVFGESYRIISSERDPMLWWCVSDSFYSIIDSDGEVVLVSRFLGDAPPSSQYRSKPHSSFIHLDGRIFIVISSLGNYELFVASLLGDSMISLDRIACQEFPSSREKLISGHI